MYPSLNPADLRASPLAEAVFSQLSEKNEILKGVRLARK